VEKALAFGVLSLLDNSAVQDVVVVGA